MKKIFFNVSEWEREYISSKLTDCEFEPGTVGETADKVFDAEIVSIFVNSNMRAEDLARFPNAKFIAARSTGYDNIDLGVTAEKNVVVSNVPSYGENTVAEYAFALLLTLSRRMYETIDATKEKGTFMHDGLQGFDLKGKTIGMVGTGRIGVNSIKIAKGFGMNVICYDAFPNEKLASEMGFMYTNLDSLLGEADIVSLHAPLLETTRHMINKTSLSKMKKGIILINTARGGLVETDALVMGLKDGTIGAVGLDVLEEEGYMADELSLLVAQHPNAESMKTVLENRYLMDHPRVVISPHNAFNTKEALTRILDTTIENIKAFEAGKPVNVVK